MTNGLTFRQFQDFIDARYSQQDRARGTPRNFMWLMEEIGELSSALAEGNSQSIEEELADVLGWLTTLANLHQVDLEQALRRKYLEQGGELHKS